MPKDSNTDRDSGMTIQEAAEIMAGNDAELEDVMLQSMCNCWRMIRGMRGYEESMYFIINRFAYECISRMWCNPC